MITCIVNFSSNKALKSAYVLLLKMELCRNFKFIFYLFEKCLILTIFSIFTLYQSINFRAFFIRQSPTKVLMIHVKHLLSLLLFLTKTTQLKFLKILPIRGSEYYPTSIKKFTDLSGIVLSFTQLNLIDRQIDR